MATMAHEAILPSLQVAAKPLLPHQLPKCLSITAKPPKTHFAQLAFSRPRREAFHLRLAACDVARWHALQAEKFFRPHN